MAVTRPPRRLRQIAAIAGRAIQIPPGAAVFYTLCIPTIKPNTTAAEWSLVYRSEAVRGTSNPQWAPLPTDLSLHGSPAEIFIAVHICGPEELNTAAESLVALDRGEKFVPGINIFEARTGELAPAAEKKEDKREEESNLEGTEANGSVPSEPYSNGTVSNLCEKDLQAEITRGVEAFVPGKACTSYLLRLDNLLALGSELAGTPAAQYFLPNTLIFDFIDGEYGAHPWLESTTTIATTGGGSGAGTTTSTTSLSNFSPRGNAASTPAPPSMTASSTATPTESPTKAALLSNTASSPFLLEAVPAAVPGLRNMLLAKLRGSMPSTAISGAESSSGASTPTGVLSNARQVPVADLRKQVDGLVALQHRIHTLASQCDEARARVDTILKQQENARGQRAQLVACAEETRELVRRRGVITRRAEEAVQRASVAERAALTTSQALVSTLQALQAANKRITAGEASLDGEEGRGRLAGALRELVARRCLMTAQLGWILRLGPSSMQVLQSPPGGLLDEQLEIHWAGSGMDSAAGSATPSSYVVPLPETGLSLGINSHNDVSPSSPERSTGSALLRRETRLAICGINLDSAVWRHAFDPGGYEWDPAQDKAASVALGYAALLVDKLAQYLGVPLRYPIKFRGSTSVVVDNYPAAGAWEPDAASAPAPTGASFLFGRAPTDNDRTKAVSVTPVEYPLYCLSNRDRPKFAVGVFLLNKDSIQLLQAHGITAAGPSQLLQNLHKLVAAAQSGLPPGLGSSYWRW